MAKKISGMQFYIDCLCKASLLEMVFVMWTRQNACNTDTLPNRTPQPAPLEVWETSLGTTSTEEPWSKPENALTVTVPGTTTQVEVLYFFSVSRCQAITHKWNVSTVDFNHLNVPGLAQCNPRMCWSCGELHFTRGQKHQDNLSNHIIQLCMKTTVLQKN